MSSTKTTIAISGIKGSFSEEAAGKFLQDQHLDGQIIYATTADTTFKTVLDGRAEYGLVPLENSNGGIVYETVYAMAKYTFTIKAIFEIDVQQNLIVRPGTRREDVRQIVSHQQALAQCRFYLKRGWQGVDMIEYADTALAAKDLADGNLEGNTAVIASKAAAKLFELEILEPSIQDLKFNFTAFLAFTR
ncbi:MAG TPA: prephenate dehydratase domain-containing protein [Candidatus Saccharimonadales bacterium]|nr:prephenate dehydratase domain-containing protein [Candidatus Saccharimonadales bacterium]